MLNQEVAVVSTTLLSLVLGAGVVLWWQHQHARQITGTTLRLLLTIFIIGGLAAIVIGTLPIDGLLLLVAAFSGIATSYSAWRFFRLYREQGLSPRTRQLGFSVVAGIAIIVLALAGR
jgi:hypothetical protein